MNVPTAILASGEGTTAEAFIRAAVAGLVDVDIKLVICNKESAGIFGRVEQLNQEFGLSIRVELINSKTHPLAPDEELSPGAQTLAEENAILDLLGQADIQLVHLMGYLRRVGPRLVYEYGWRTEYTIPYQARMLNTHPGLLPETKGLWGIHVQELVIEAGLPFGGQTLHVVAEDYDDGPVLVERKVAVEPDETAESLFEKVKATEKQFLPEDVQAFILAREQYLATT